MKHNELVRYNAARQALQEAYAVDEVKDIRDKAQALAAYARQAKDKELISWATEIKVRAERRSGELLKDSAERGERATGGNPQLSRDTTVRPTLSALGISRDQSSRWQKLAEMPDDQFEAAIETAKEVAGEVTTAAMLRIAKPAPEPRIATSDVDPAPVDPLQPPRPAEIFGAVETLARTDIDPADYQSLIPHFQWYHIDDHIDAAIKFLTLLKAAWRNDHVA